MSSSRLLETPYALPMHRVANRSAKVGDCVRLNTSCLVHLCTPVFVSTQAPLSIMYPCVRLNTGCSVHHVDSVRYHTCLPVGGNADRGPRPASWKHPMHYLCIGWLTDQLQTLKGMYSMPTNGFSDLFILCVHITLVYAIIDAFLAL